MNEPYRICLDYKQGIIRKYNMLTGGVGGRASTCSEPIQKGVVFMGTYEEFMVILTCASLIVAILNYTHKNSRPTLESFSSIFRALSNPQCVYRCKRHNLRRM